MSRPSRRRRGIPMAEVTEREVVLHGQPVRFLETGADSGGPVVVLLHGLASSSRTWEPILLQLGRHAHVVAPDLLGHGLSAKPRSGDYSLGAHAVGVRDLLVTLGLESATVVGHSFGGGVAMQFAYQFPEFTQRLVLVASGGFGRQVSFALRAASLPGTSLVLQAAAALTPRWVARAVQRALSAAPTVSSSEIDGLAEAFASFGDRDAAAAFAQTVRGALDWSGQRLDATGRLYLLSETPVLFVAGSRDAVIPVGHTVSAHALVPDSRLEVIDGAGHFPHVEQPRCVAGILIDFLDATTPAPAGRGSLRRRLRAITG